jgi:hypothetical protein
LGRQQHQAEPIFEVIEDKGQSAARSRGDDGRPRAYRRLRWLLKRTGRYGTEGKMETDNLDPVLQRLDRIEAALAELLQQRTIKDWYGTDEVAEILSKAEFTVREWARLGRIHAQKRGSGRGKFQSWVVSHTELLRIQKEGLLPIQRPA